MRQACALLCVCVLGGAHAPAWGESMTEAVASSLEYFPDFRAVQANRRAAVELVGQARGAYYPSADLTLGSGRERTDSPGTRVQGQGDVTLNRRESELTVTQLLFDFGATASQVRSFTDRADGAGYQVTNAAETVALRAGLAYLEVLRLRGQVVLARENVSSHERTVRQVDTLVERGAGRRSDLQQAAGRLALAQNQLTQAEGQLAQAETAYRHVVGAAPGVLRRPEGLAEHLPIDIDRVVAEAVAAHPAVLAAEREHSAAQADRDSARGRLAPRLNLEAGVARNTDIDGVRGVNDERFVMLRLRSNLFRGGADLARTREAEARLDEAGANLGRVRNDVERDLRQAWQGLNANRARIGELERHAEISAQVVEAYRAQFGIGQRTLLDVLNSENELYNARASALNGTLAVSADEVRVLAAVGRLLNALGLSMPPEERSRDAER
jgi:adhesin transport system outer membrane protein